MTKMIEINKKLRILYTIENEFGRSSKMGVQHVQKIQAEVWSIWLLQPCTKGLPV